MPAMGRQRVGLIGCAVAIWSCAMIWLALASGVQHDYGPYLQQWQLVLSGSDPWATDNAYGPLHNVLAYLLPLGDLAPKLAIVGALLVANAALLSVLIRSAAEGWFAIYLLAVPANCLIVSMAFAYGLNDALVSALVVGAIIARQGDRPIGAGLFLGIAALLKFYPIILVPLFAMDAGRVRWKLIVAASAVATAGMGAGALMWGDAITSPLLLAVEREPKILSILSALSFHPYLVGGPGVVDVLVRANVMLVGAAALVSTLVAWKLKMHWLEASVLGLLAVLITYKVGHQQFYLPWLFLVAATACRNTERGTTRDGLYSDGAFLVRVSVGLRLRLRRLSAGARGREAERRLRRIFTGAGDVRDIRDLSGPSHSADIEKERCHVS